MDGTPFGRYRLVALLGRGGMGEVWRAHDTETDRIVALKLLPAHLSQDEDFQRRFRREAHAAARLNDPHVIPIHNYGEIDGRLYVDMRLVEGRDLHTLLADGPFEPARAVRIIDQVAKALHAAHEVGLLHRDIKPSNIVLGRDDFAYLIDFGIARAMDETRMTKSGSTIGTFDYIAPERLDFHAQEDARADVYSLACVLYEALTGEPPFPAHTTAQLMFAHINSPPPRPSSTQPNVPPALDAVIATGMAKDPDQRYATTIEFAAAARDAISVPTPPPTPGPPTLRATQPAHHLVTTQQSTVQADSSATAKAAAPPQPPATHTRTRAGRTGRTKIVLIVAAVALVAVIAAVVGISVLGKQGPARSSPASSSPPTFPKRSYGVQEVIPFADHDHPYNVAADSAGNLYISGYIGGDNRVLKLTAGSSTQDVLPVTGLNNPGAVAVDSGGNLYVTECLVRSRVMKLATGSSGWTELPFTGLNCPAAVAVDNAGNLYVADSFNQRVVKLAAGPSTQEVLPFSGLLNPSGVAVDSAGNVYVTDPLPNGAGAPDTTTRNPPGPTLPSMVNKRVLKLPAGSPNQEVLPFSGLNYPAGVAVDSDGNLYVTDLSNKRVLKLPAGSSNQEVLPFTGLDLAYSIAVDGAGNLYVADPRNHRVLKLPVR